MRTSLSVRRILLILPWLALAGSPRSWAADTSAVAIHEDGPTGVVRPIATNVLGRFLVLEVPASQPAVPKPHIDHDGLSKLTWQLACQAATFRQMTCFEMIDLLHSLDVHHIELAPGQMLSLDHPRATIDPAMTQVDVDALLAKLQTVHMDIVSFGVVPMSNNETDIRAVFEFGRKLKVKNIIAEPTVDSLPLLDRLTESYHVNLAIANGASSSPWADADGLAKALADRSARIGVCADLANWSRGGRRPLDCIQKFAGRVIEIRLNDVNERNQDVPLGSGIVQSADVLTWLKQNNFKGVCSVGYNASGGQNPLNNWILSANAFSDVVTRLASGKN